MNTESRTTNSIRNILVGIVGQGLLLIAGFFNRIIFVRCLSESYVGVNGLFISIISALGMAELGIGAAVGYELYSGLSKGDENKLTCYIQWYGRVYKIIALFISIIGISLIPILPFLTKNDVTIKENLTIIYLLYLINTVVTYFFSYKAAIIRADQKEYKLKLLGNLLTLMLEAVRVAVLLLTKSFYLYLVCNICGTLLDGYVVAKIAEKDYPFIKKKTKQRLSKDEISRLFINIKALVVSRIGCYLVNGTDSIIISALNGLNITGIVSNFTLLTASLNNIIMQFVSGITASVGNLNASESHEKTISVFWEMSLFCFWLYGWATTAFIIIGNDIVNLFFGKEYMLSYKIVAVMGMNFYTAGIMNSSWTFKNGMGLFKYGQYMNFIMGIINIICSIILGKMWGVFGVLLSTTISRMSTDYWYSPYAVFKYGFRLKFYTYITKWLYQILCLFVTVIITQSIISVVEFRFIDSFLLKLLICAIVPNIVFLLFWIRTREFKCLLNRVCQLVSKMRRRQSI